MRRALDRVEELGEAHPVPRHAGLHRGEGDRFDAGHREHRPLALVGAHRSEAEAAVADGRRRDPVPPGERAVRVPEHLGVVVGMEIDEAGGDVQALRVQDLARIVRRNASDRGDDPVLDSDVRAIPRHAGSIEDSAVADEPIKGRHGRPPLVSSDRSNERSHSPSERASAAVAAAGQWFYDWRGPPVDARRARGEVPGP